MSGWCECAACGRQFTGLAPFDRHQHWDYKRVPGLICRDPAELGMKQDRFGRWGSAQKRPIPTRGSNSAGLTGDSV